MIQNERDCRHEHVLDVARQMMTAVRTAPKAKGSWLGGEDIGKLAEEMVAMVEGGGHKFFPSGRRNLLQAECVVINRYARASSRFELRALRFSYLRRTCRGSSMCFEAP